MTEETNREEHLVTASRAARRKSRSRKRAGGTAFVILLAAAAAFLILYFTVVQRDTFWSGTTINGVDVSGMNAKQAEDAIIQKWETRTITITQDGSEIAQLSLAGIQYDLSSEVEKCLHPNFFRQFQLWLSASSRKMTISMKVSGTTDTFDQAFSSLDIVRNGNGTTTTQNAYVDLSTTDFNVVKEVYGDNMDQEKLKKAILRAVKNRKDSFAYDPAEYYTQPTITADSKEIRRQLSYCRKYLSQKITYKTPMGTYTLTPAEINEMIQVKNGKIQVNESKVEDFVKNTLAAKVSTVGVTRTLTSCGGGTFTVSGGTYGLRLDTDAEITELEKDLKSGKDVTRWPNYTTKANSDGSYDLSIGSDYVEISLSAQHVWIVRSGSVVADGDVVTGDVSSGNSTPTGIYYILYKTTDTTLTDNETYESHVNFWMPFYGGIGMHDSSWRSTYGGQIYLTNGSHGCVNMPYSLARTAYQNVYPGMPVVVHN